MEKHDATKRKFVKTAAYVTPAILTLQAVSTYAKAGSEKEKDLKSPKDPKPAKPPKPRDRG